jgi:hypothetical protein
VSRIVDLPILFAFHFLAFAFSTFFGNLIFVEASFFIVQIYNSWRNIFDFLLSPNKCFRMFVRLTKSPIKHVNNGATAPSDQRLFFLMGHVIQSNGETRVEETTKKSMGKITGWMSSKLIHCTARNTPKRHTRRQYLAQMLLGRVSKSPTTNQTKKKYQKNPTTQFNSVQNSRKRNSCKHKSRRF